MIKYVSIGKTLNIIERIPNIDEIIRMLKYGVRSANSHWAEANGTAEAVRSLLKTIKSDERVAMNKFLNYFGLTILSDNRFYKSNPNKSNIDLLSDDVKNFIEKINESGNAKRYLKDLEVSSFSIRCERLIKIINEVAMITNELSYIT
jgi:hypothetical protein